MKTITFALFLLAIMSMRLTAQQDVSLPGEVVEQNSKFYTGQVHFLSGVEIKAPGGNATTSNSQGMFDLVFTDKAIGTTVRVFAFKQGYELVNDEEMKKTAIIGRRSPMKVVMCPQGQLFEMQNKYYAIAYDAKLKAYDRQLAILEQEGKEKEDLLIQMAKDFNVQRLSSDSARALLYTQLQDAQRQAQELSEKFSTVNLDDQTETYQRAFQAFMEKDIDLAIQILDSLDLKAGLEADAALIAKAKGIIEEKHAAIDTAKFRTKQRIEQLLMSARMHTTKFKFNEADSLYGLAWLYGSENLNLAWEYAVFLQKQQRYEVAAKIYSDLLTEYQIGGTFNPESGDSTVAKTLANYGMLMSHIGNDSLAKAYNEQALRIYRHLAKTDPWTYLPFVGIALNNQGILLKNMNEVPAAQEHFEEALKIYRKLATTDGNGNLPSLAMTLNNLGVLLEGQNEFVAAKEYYLEALKIDSGLAQDSQGLYLPDLAKSHNNLGVLFTNLGNFPAAKSHFEDALQLRRDLAGKNPEVYASSVANTLHNLGSVMRRTGELSTAFAEYQEALEIRRELARKNPLIYLPSVATTLRDFAALLFEMNEFSAARRHYEECLEIQRSLASKNKDIYLPQVGATLRLLASVATLEADGVAAHNYELEALNVFSQCFEQNRTAYGFAAARVSVCLGYFDYKQYLSSNEIGHKAAGVGYIMMARKFLAAANESALNVTAIQDSIDWLEIYFHYYNELASLEKVKMETDLAHKKVMIQFEIVRLWLQIQDRFPQNTVTHKGLADAYGSLAWWQLMDRNFAAAKSASRKGLRVMPERIWINTNLAAALLYQGKWQKAKAIYLRLKDEFDLENEMTFREIFIEDLDTLETEGITHPDVGTARKLLEK